MPDAVVEPSAVMVELLHTLVALATVFGTQSHIRVTDIAVIVPHHCCVSFASDALLNQSVSQSSTFILSTNQQQKQGAWIKFTFLP